MNQLISTLDLYFGQKAPQLPQGFKGFLVKIAPWAAIIGIIFTVPVLLAVMGLGFIAMPGAIYAGEGYGMGGLWLSVIFAVITIIMYIVAIPGLFSRSPMGWNMLFYILLLGGLSQLLLLNLVGLIINLAIGFYVLFQVRPYYFGGVTSPLSAVPNPSPEQQY